MRLTVWWQMNVCFVSLHIAGRDWRANAHWHKVAVLENRSQDRGLSLATSCMSKEGQGCPGLVLWSLKVMIWALLLLWESQVCVLSLRGITPHLTHPWYSPGLTGCHLGGRSGSGGGWVWLQQWLPNFNPPPGANPMAWIHMELYQLYRQCRFQKIPCTTEAYPQIREQLLPHANETSTAAPP